MQFQGNLYTKNKTHVLLLHFISLLVLPPEECIWKSGSRPFKDHFLSRNKNK